MARVIQLVDTEGLLILVLLTNSNICSVCVIHKMVVMRSAD